MELAQDFVQWQAVVLLVSNFHTLLPTSWMIILLYEIAQQHTGMSAFLPKLIMSWLHMASTRFILHLHTTGYKQNFKMHYYCNTVCKMCNHEILQTLTIFSDMI